MKDDHTTGSRITIISTPQRQRSEFYRMFMDRMLENMRAADNPVFSGVDMASSPDLSTVILRRDGNVLHVNFRGRRDL